MNHAITFLWPFAWDVFQTFSIPYSTYWNGESPLLLLVCELAAWERLAYDWSTIR